MLPNAYFPIFSPPHFSFFYVQTCHLLKVAQILHSLPFCSRVYVQISLLRGEAVTGDGSLVTKLLIFKHTLPRRVPLPAALEAPPWHPQRAPSRPWATPAP